MGRAAESAIIADKELAAPDRPIGAEAGTVEGDTDHGLFEPVIRHATGDVRLMMLHCQSRRRVGPFAAIASGRVVGMQVVDKQLRTKLEQPLIVGNGKNERAIGFIVVKVAQVVAQEGVSAAPRANVDLSCPPTASIGRGHGTTRSSGRGA